MIAIATLVTLVLSAAMIGGGCAVIAVVSVPLLWPIAFLRTRLLRSRVSRRARHGSDRSPT